MPTFFGLVTVWFPLLPFMLLHFIPLCFAEPGTEVLLMLEERILQWLRWRSSSGSNKVIVQYSSVLIIVIPLTSKSKRLKSTLMRRIVLLPKYSSIHVPRTTEDSPLLSVSIISDFVARCAFFANRSIILQRASSEYFLRLWHIQASSINYRMLRYCFSIALEARFIRVHCLILRLLDIYSWLTVHVEMLLIFILFRVWVACFFDRCRHHFFLHSLGTVATTLIILKLLLHLLWKWLIITCCTLSSSVHSSSHIKVSIHLRCTLLLILLILLLGILIYLKLWCLRKVLRLLYVIIGQVMICQIQQLVDELYSELLLRI